MDEQVRQSLERLERARRQILAADARLRFYAYVDGASDDELGRARGDWNAAVETLWRELQARPEALESIEAFSNVTESLVILTDTLEIGLKAPEGAPPGGV